MVKRLSFYYENRKGSAPKEEPAEFSADLPETEAKPGIHGAGWGSITSWTPHVAVAGQYRQIGQVSPVHLIW